MTRTYIPFDVWRCVSEFISDEELSRISSVNLALRDIAREITFRNVEAVCWDKRTKERLRALGNPALGLGQHVRALTLKPWPVSSKAKVHSKRMRVWNKVNALIDSEYPSRYASTQLKRKIEKHIDLVAATAANLTNLHEYSVQWSPAEEYCPELFSAFLGPMLTGTRLARNITKLSVFVSMEKLSSLAPLHLPKLAHLELEFHTGKMLTGEINDHLDSLIVFVNNTSRSLRTLSVSSTPDSRHLDLNRFFHHLGTFIHLTSFSLAIPHDGAHVSSPAFIISPPNAKPDSVPLDAFIQKHADHLEVLVLKCRRAPPPAERPDPRAKFWIQRILSQIAGGELVIGHDRSAGSVLDVRPSNEHLTPFASLHTLEVPLRPLKSSLVPLQKCIMRLGPQLKSLSLNDRAITEHEFQMLSGVSSSPYPNETPSFASASQLSLTSSVYSTESSATSISSNIAKLSLRIQTLSPYLLDLLAQAVPGLRKLEVEVIDTGAGYAPCRLTSSAMQHSHYTDWKLRELRIRAPPSSRAQTWGKGVMDVLKACIPGLQVEVEVLRYLA